MTKTMFILLIHQMWAITVFFTSNPLALIPMLGWTFFLISLLRETSNE